MIPKLKSIFSLRTMSPARLILLGFLCIILLGAFLLTLPVSTRNGQGAPFVDALFTATSATCVTGLILHDTYSYWTVFGQLVILTLIQIGGMGVITIAIAFFILSGKKIGLKQRIVMQEAIAAPQMGGILRMTKFLISRILLFETAGALLLSLHYVPKLGLAIGVWNAIFSSISAFCNAGFDLMGRYAQFSSLTASVGDPLVNLTITSLIIIGGIGFFVWYDIRQHRLDFIHYSLQSKLVLITTLALILLPTFYFFFLEFQRPVWDGMPVTDKLWASYFQAVSPRTAGFNTVDLTKLSDSSVLVSVILMMIGGSPSSTAGGFKTTTIAVLFLCLSASLRRKNRVTAFHKELPTEVLLNALTVFFLYLSLLIGAVILLLALEPFSLREILYEVASAIATVGLTLGITPELSFPSKLIITALMYFGRVGALTLLYAVSSRSETVLFRYPKEGVTIG